MKTDASKKFVDWEQYKSKSSENVEAMKTRKTLHPLQEAAGDKENLVGAGRMPPNGKEALRSLKKVATSPSTSKIEKKKQTESSILKTDKKISAEDLTSEAGPSEKYWEILAERRRTALDQALQENRKLHERIIALEAENEQCRKLLEESKTVIDTLTELLNEPDQGTDDSSFFSDESILRTRDE